MSKKTEDTFTGLESEPDSYYSGISSSTDLVERYKSVVVDGYDLTKIYGIDELESDEDLDWNDDADYTANDRRVEYMKHRPRSYADVIKKYKTSNDENEVEPSVAGSLLNEMGKFGIVSTSGKFTNPTIDNGEIVAQMTVEDTDIENQNPEKEVNKFDDNHHADIDVNFKPYNFTPIEHECKNNNDCDGISKQEPIKSHHIDFGNHYEHQKLDNVNEVDSAVVLQSHRLDPMEMDVVNKNEMDVGIPNQGGNFPPKNDVMYDVDLDDINASTIKETSNTRRCHFKRKICFFGVIFFLTFAAFACALAYVLTKNKQTMQGDNEVITTARPTLPPTPNKPPTQPPTLRPTSPEGEKRNDAIISNIATITNTAILFDEQTPQNKALQWIIYHDPAELPADATNIIQRYTLATLYYSTNGETWKTCGNTDNESETCGNEDDVFVFMSSVPECKWYGVQCQGDNITNIDLSNNRLRGTIPGEISSLSYLTGLNLSYNKIKGQIPSELPPGIREINLENNSLQGFLPDDLHRLLDLRTFSVGNNKLSGELPATMFTPSLEIIDLSGNLFEGSIPMEIFKSQRLEEIDLSSNSFSGTIGFEWGRAFDNLLSLNLQANQFAGTLPKELFTVSLYQLSAGMNQLTGTIPDSVFDSKMLEYLNLGANEFNGTISTKFGKMTSMKHLILWNNKFTGQLPKEIGTMSSLELFQIQYNYLSGEVPSEVCDLTPKPLSIFGADCEAANDGVARLTCHCCNFCVKGHDN